MPLSKFHYPLAALFVLADVTGIAQISQPRLGYVLDSAGTLRPVLGMAASASLGDPVLRNIISFACSSTLCLAKTDAAVVAFALTPRGGGQSGAIPPPVVTPCACPGTALIALDPPGAASAGAWVFLAETRQLARWHDGALEMVDFSPGGEILSTRATADGFDFAIARSAPIRRSLGRAAPEHAGNIVWLEHYSAIDGSLGAFDSMEALGAVMLLDGGVLLSTIDHVILRRSGGQELTFPLTDPTRFQAAGSGYVEIVSGQGLSILRTDPGNEQLSLLPGSPQESSSRVIRGPGRRATPRPISGAAVP